MQDTFSAKMLFYIGSIKFLHNSILSTYATLHTGIIHIHVLPQSFGLLAYEQKLALKYSFTITIRPMKQEQRNRILNPHINELFEWELDIPQPIKIEINSNYIITK